MNADIRLSDSGPNLTDQWILYAQNMFYLCRVITYTEHRFKEMCSFKKKKKKEKKKLNMQAQFKSNVHLFV